MGTWNGARLKVSRMNDLADGWDSYGGKRADARTIHRALALSEVLERIGVDPPAMVTLTSGGHIEFEWEAGAAGFVLCTDGKWSALSVDCSADI